MNPTEIYDALSDIASSPFNADEFPFAFAEATDAAKAAVSKLRNGSTNKSDIPGGVLFNRKFHYAPALNDTVDTMLAQLQASKRTKSAKPAVLITTDGETVAAKYPSTDETLHCAFDEIGENFGFFLPAAGKERYQAVEENPVDIKATGKLAKLYDALIKVNPEWSTDARRHEMNQFMMRLIFCMFAEDVRIFPEGQFTELILTHAGKNGIEAREAFIAAFTAMNRPKDQRAGLPFWTAKLEYVNGGLFAGEVDAPQFNTIAFRYLRDAFELNWREINPDIFGSMIQSVANPAQRAELGMHYTSVPNIMKVIGPLFLDDLDSEIENAWHRPKVLEKILDRMAGIRVFDPACGSGNFLVVSYRRLREREMRILKRLEEIRGPSSLQMFSLIPITNFFGIEVVDFAAETAKLALFIAEYQANTVFAEMFGRKPPALPLREAAHIVHGNSLQISWEQVCPFPNNGEEVFIAGNPPFLGKAQQDTEQKSDMDTVFAGHIKNYRAFDLVTAWFFKAASYLKGKSVNAALVATNSICQGASASNLWPAILTDNIEIGFAHRSFKWRNNASANAAVVCVIVGLRNRTNSPKRLFDAGLESTPGNINPYLLDGPNVVVRSTGKSLFGLPQMDFGCMPYDGGNLLMDAQAKDALLKDAPNAKRFVRRFMGSQEVVKGYERYCLWISDDELREAMNIQQVAYKVEATRAARLKMKDKGGQELALRPHQFREHIAPKNHAILIPSVTSERRPYLPVERVGPNVISSNLNQVLYDAPDWCIALIASRLHLIWIGTVCGRLESRFRYSNTLGWNTFPVPKFTETQLEQLTQSARKILKTRYTHYPATIADLYDPCKMPDDLRVAHRENDDLLESMYIGRPFRNDTERLERLFKLYTAKIKSLDKNGDT